MKVEEAVPSLILLMVSVDVKPHLKKNLTFTRVTKFPRCIANRLIHRKIRSTHCSWQFCIQCHGSENYSESSVNLFNVEFLPQIQEVGKEEDYA